MLVMSWEFSFSTRLHLAEDESGLFVPVTFSSAGEEVELKGYFDTGSKFCVIPRWAGESLGLDIETGQAISLRTGGGPMPVYLHYVSLTIGDLFFEDVPICVAKYRDFDRCMVGRAGWFQKVRLNLVPYDEHLFLNLHGQ
jgi:hypothetical protein